MTMPVFTTKKCAVCGKRSQQTGLASTNRFGAPDLDMRPPPMERSTMMWWIERCVHCGYIASDIGEKAAVSKAWLKKKEYVTCSGISFASELAADYYRKYLIDVASRDIERAYSSILCAAWACDDADDLENARRCRLLALQELDVIIKINGAADSLTLIRADIMRRSGLFDELLGEYKDTRLADAELQKLLDFQLEKARQHDPRCYTVEAAANADAQ